MDKVEFYRGEDSDWWWKRTAPNNERVGGSTEGYKNLQDCVNNAVRDNGTEVEYVNPQGE